MTSFPDPAHRALRRGFTLIELVVAGTVAALVLTAVTFSLSQLGRARSIATDRAEAFQRASVALEELRRDIASAVRSDDLFDCRFLLTTEAPSARNGNNERSDLLLFAESLRPNGEIDYQGEGREYETHYRVEDDELGSALWRRRDPVPDEIPDGGGVAAPIADGIVSLVIEASDAIGAWRTEWDSDIDGMPMLVRITVAAVGTPVGLDVPPTETRVTLQTMVVLDRVTAPRSEPLPEEPGTGTEGSAAGGLAGGGATAPRTGGAAAAAPPVALPAGAGGIDAAAAAAAAGGGRGGFGGGAGAAGRPGAGSGVGRVPTGGVRGGGGGGRGGGGGTGSGRGGPR